MSDAILTRNSDGKLLRSEAKNEKGMNKSNIENKKPQGMKIQYSQILQFINGVQHTWGQMCG